MDDSGDLRLASLLASRLCHDLVGPLGAVDNGLELMAENGEMAGEAMALAQRSAKRATSRLQLFRFAFGAAGGEEHFGPGEARALAMECLHTPTVAIDWPAAMELPPGGLLTVEKTQEAVAVVCEGIHIRLLPEVKAAVEGEAALDGLSARTVVGHYAQRLARVLGWRIRATEEGQGRLR